MVSITSGASSYVLANLRQLNNDLSTAQTRIGTGKKVNSSSDNAAAWKSAQTLRSDIKAQDNLSTGIAKAQGRADAAVKAIDSVITLAGKIRELADGVVASDPGVYTTVTNKVNALKAQIVSVMSGAGFAGENWLTDAIATKSVTIGINSGTAATIAVDTVELDALDDPGTGGTNEDGPYTTFAAIAAISNTTTAGTLSTGAGTLIAALTAYQGTLSTFSQSLGIQQDFQASLKTVRETTLSSIVDADITAESAKLTAFQTQQQLAYQALSIGNSSASSILRLFQ